MAELKVVLITGSLKGVGRFLAYHFFGPLFEFSNAEFSHLNLPLTKQTHLSAKCLIGLWLCRSRFRRLGSSN